MYSVMGKHSAARNGVWIMKLTFDTIRAIAPVPPRTEIMVFDDDAAASHSQSAGRR